MPVLLDEDIKGLLLTLKDTANATMEILRPQDVGYATVATVQCTVLPPEMQVQDEDLAEYGQERVTVWFEGVTGYTPRVGDVLRINNINYRIQSIQTPDPAHKGAFWVVTCQSERQP